MNSKVRNLTIGGVISYGVLKLTQSKIDPYTRFAIGISVGTSLSISQNQTIRYFGIGIGIASILQLVDVKKGGKISFNNSSNKVFVLHETEGVIELKPNEIPYYNIDGFTIKGLNAVFKLSDGVYAGINKYNKIHYSFGIGLLINKYRKAGLMSVNWVNTQTDKRWQELYKKSV